MRRMFALEFVWAVLAVCSADAVPARQAHAPPAPSKKAALDLRGTVWDGAPIHEDRMIVFEPDGGLTYGLGKNRGGSWRLEGNTVYFELNNAFRMFRGTVQGNFIQGESWNVVGTHWQTRLLRVPASK
jgi:hypothetical protein